MPRSKGVDWDRVDLGQRPDPVIAREMGLAITSVRQARVKRGIPRAVLVVTYDNSKFHQRVLEGLAWDGSCLVWTRGTDSYGYGTVRCREVIKKTHRVIYELFVGPIPDGLCVLHHCDNPPCALPEHLFLGTQLDNIKDMDQKNRRVMPLLRGEDSSGAKLTWEAVREIRRLYRLGGVTQTSLAATFGVSGGTIRFIVNGETWVE